MEITIKQYRYVQEEIGSKVVSIPTETVYFFQTGIRRAIRIDPIYTTWNVDEGKQEEIWSIKVTFVYGSFENKIESFSYSVHDLEDLYFAGKNEFIKAWFNGHLLKRTKEDFDSDFQNVLNNLE